MHATSFLLNRIPRDRWAKELLQLKALGVNAVDVYPFWNWHQPQEDVVDFDGHTNPRRDLKYLLELCSAVGFKVSIRPGPYSTGEWKNGGYPDWLLRKPEYGMSEQSILEGRYPRLSALQYAYSEDAAEAWLKNPTHLKYTREWYQQVLAVIKPFLATNGGPVISVQLDDDQAAERENYNGPHFWQYMDLLRRYAKQATDGAQVPYYVNGSDMRLNAEANYVSAEPFWNMGQDYPYFGSYLGMPTHDPSGYSTIWEAAKGKFRTELLKTEPLFAPTLIEFHDGWRLSERDTYARFSDPTNMLIVSRVMFQNGLKGLSYYYLTDGLSPAGSEAQWANYFYSRESALNFAGKECARAVYVRRNGRLLVGMGPLLASSHFLADAGLIYPMATYPQAPLTMAETNLVANVAARLLWSGVFEHYNFELIDSDYTPDDNFNNYKSLLLPNFVNTHEELKKYPHLGAYSGAAQRHVLDYLQRGGTLLVFPSIPQGKIFAQLFAPLGTERLVRGDTTVSFADGAQARLLRNRTVLLPRGLNSSVKVFARDASGGVVGARFAVGKGQVLFYGSDFSTWCLPQGTGLLFSGDDTPGRPPSIQKAGSQGPNSEAPNDFSEGALQAAKAALPALMAEAGISRGVSLHAKPTRARDPGLYATELIADSCAQPEEQQQAAGCRGFGFLGVTNFNAEQAQMAGIVATDPQALSSSLPAAQRTLQLPNLTLPPRESLVLPLRVPLVNSFWKMPPGLVTTDEIYFATAELSRVTYDGSKLQLEFTAPSDAVVTLRLSRHVQEARIDGEPASLQEDLARRLLTLKIPRGQPPHFLRTIELTYPSSQPRMAILPGGPWIAGSTQMVGVRVENRWGKALEGDLDFSAGTLSKGKTATRSVLVPPRSSVDVIFPVGVPAEAIDNLPVDLEASFREKGSSSIWAWRATATVHPPFSYDIDPILTFPLREDQSFPIVHPVLATLNLPGEARFQIRIKNWFEHESTVVVTAEGSDLTLTSPVMRVDLPPQGEKTVELRAVPKRGSKVYPIRIRMQSGTYEVAEEVALAAFRAGEALAYTLDYDRDGFEDVILENQRIRCFISPHAGGRSFAFVLKSSGTNAFDSVGGMRDTFSTHFEAADQKDLPASTRANWLGLYNRPYAYQIVLSAGAQAGVRLEYRAPDIYPAGVNLERVLTLRGDSNTIVEEIQVEPQAGEESQSYILDTSVPFRVFDQPNYNQWFTSAHAIQDFVPQQKINLGLGGEFIGTFNKKTGETFALMLLDPIAKSELIVENHSALIRVHFPPLAVAKHRYGYRVAFHFGNESPSEMEGICASLVEDYKRHSK